LVGQINKKNEPHQNGIFEKIIKNAISSFQTKKKKKTPINNVHDGKFVMLENILSHKSEKLLVLLLQPLCIVSVKKIN
jgi:hypothetical protein